MRGLVTENRIKTEKQAIVYNEAYEVPKTPNGSEEIPVKETLKINQINDSADAKKINED